MNQREREMLVETIENYISILHDRGLDHSIPDREELMQMSGPQLSHLARQLRDLARTPST